MAQELDLNGHRYSIGKLSAKQQFHVSRRIAPIVPTLIPVFVRLAAGGRGITEDPGGMADVLQPLADGLAAMKDEDADYVLDTCLQAVQRRQEHGWTAIWSAGQRVPMFQDIDLSVMLPLALRVIVGSLGPFIQGLLTSQTGSPEATQAG
ncbi:phage tail assembly chaperone [Achromobacter xylosoxidans]